MQSLRLYGPHDMRLVDEPTPVASADQVLVRITAVGICGSDLHWFEEGGIGDARISRPFVLGHEFAGIIASGPEEGLRVAVDPAINCETCRYCVEGNPNLCERIRFAGHSEQDGALRQFLSWPRRLMHPLPEGFSDSDGAMLEPLGVAIHAADLGRIKPDDKVAIFGCGPIGLLILQVARARGARVVLATDRLKHRLEMASKLGAELVVSIDGSGPRKQIDAIAADHYIDTVFEASTSNDAVEDAVAAVRPGGRAVLAGIPSDNRTAFDAGTARRKGLTLRLVRRMKETYPQAIEMVKSGQVDVSALVSHDFDLAEHQAAFSVAVARSGLKVILHP